MKRIVSWCLAFVFSISLFPCINSATAASEIYTPKIDSSEPLKLARNVETDGKDYNRLSATFELEARDSVPALRIGMSSGNPGETITIPVSIENNTGFAGFTFGVSYSEGMTLTKVAKGSLLRESESGALTSNLSKGLINWNDVENLNGDGQLFVLSFLISDSAASGDKTVAIALKDENPSNFVDEAGVPLSVVFYPGTVTVNGHEHQYVDVVSPPSCTEQGYTTHTCQICGDNYVDTYVDPLGHDWSDWILTTPPTTTEPGIETRSCYRCGATETRNTATLSTTILVGSTNGGNGEVVTVPVSIIANPGFAGFTLEVNCPESLQLTKVAKGALLRGSDGGALTSNLSKRLINWNDVENTNGDGELFILSLAISETAAPGSYPIIIQIKDEKPSNFVNENGAPISIVFEAGAVILQQHEHQYVDSITPPTCTDEGFTTHTCTICGDSYIDAELPALGHDWDIPSYIWSEDDSTVIASRLCKHDATHTESETVNTVYEVTLWATAEQEGSLVYTAVFENAAFETQQKTVAIPKLSEDELPCDGGAFCPGLRFSDLPPKGHWAHDAIDWSIVLGITAGTSPTTFSPSAPCTRAQIVTFLWRAAGSPEPTAESCRFTDVPPTAFYYKAVLWALENGITTGISETSFHPNGYCSREQAVTFLWRFSGSVIPAFSDCSFTDVGLDSYAYDAIRWAVEQGITSGTSETTFSPRMTCTRAHIAVFLWHYATGE